MTLAELGYTGHFRSVLWRGEAPHSLRRQGKLWDGSLAVAVVLNRLPPALAVCLAADLQHDARRSERCGWS